MKKLLWLCLWLGLIAPAQAVVQQTTVGNANYSILNTDTTVVTTTAFTANRTWTLPFAAGTCIGQSCAPPANALVINDLAGAIAWNHTLTITPQSGETINGQTGSVTLSAAGAQATLAPTSGTNWSLTTAGDYVTSGACPSNASTATVTITIATPGVITDTAHGFVGACPVVFTTSGALPTGITSGTTYWVAPSSITTDTYSLSTTVANALAGTLIATSGSQSGTQTRTSGAPLATTTAANITGVSLTQGEWDCRATVSRVLAASTSVTVLSGSISATSATSGTQGTNSVTRLQTAANVMGATGEDTKIGPDRNAPTSTTNYFLVAQDTFTVSTNNAYGALTCRRVK